VLIAVVPAPQVQVQEAHVALQPAQNVTQVPLLQVWQVDRSVHVPLQQVFPEAQHPVPQQYLPLAQQVAPQHCWPGGQQVAVAPVPQHPDPEVAQQVLPQTVVPGVSQTLPHNVVPVGQAQVPLWQVIPPVQTVPQDPQLALSAFRSTQLPLQQAGVVPAVQVVPQDPQLVVLVCRLMQVPLQQVGAAEVHVEVQVPLVHVSQFAVLQVDTQVPAGLVLVSQR